MKDRRKKRAVALLLIIFLSVSPCLPFLQGGMLAQAASFTIRMKDRRSMLTDVSFDFFGERIGSGIYYWMKNDGSPLLCVQQHARLGIDLNGAEAPDGIASGKYFTSSQYELVSLVLQCCGMRRGESDVLEAGDYLAAQAAVWGILSPNWMGTEQLKQEMEVLYGHVRSWCGISAQELKERSAEMIDTICQAIEENYGDTSRYIPSFASKYEEKAPVWQAQWQEDGTCQVVFERGDKSEAIKDYVFQLPDGWTCQWEEDEIVFTCEQPQNGMIQVTGTASEGSLLSEAMPIGLIYIAWPSAQPNYQHLASGVDVTVPLRCYFKIYTPPRPEDLGSWYLPGGELYRHQEDFTALYGIELEKRDGDTGDPLEGVEFQVLEHFDTGQLEGTILDKEQIETWDGWKARCEKQLTGEDGRLSHWDKKTYHFEKTYCGGHPDPEITYDGTSDRMREQLEKEAWEAWETAVEGCAALCDYHAVDGSGGAQLEAERDLAYDQFTALVYGYTVEETGPLEGYRPLGSGAEDPGRTIPRIACTSAQAKEPYWEEAETERGGQAEKEVGPDAQVPEDGAAGETTPEETIAQSPRNVSRVMMAAAGSEAVSGRKEDGQKARKEARAESSLGPTDGKEGGRTLGEVEGQGKGSSGMLEDQEKGGLSGVAEGQGNDPSGVTGGQEKGDPSGASEGQGKAPSGATGGQEEEDPGASEDQGKAPSGVTEGQEKGDPSGASEDQGKAPSGVTEGQEKGDPSGASEGQGNDPSDVTGGQGEEAPPGVADGQEEDGSPDGEADRGGDSSSDGTGGPGGDPAPDGADGQEGATPIEGAEGPEGCLPADRTKEQEGGLASDEEEGLEGEDVLDSTGLWPGSEDMGTRSDAAPDVAEGEEELVRPRQKRLQRRSAVWLTSLISPLEQKDVSSPSFYRFILENYRIEPPKESDPEESQPEESQPEESDPEESQPEESDPEGTQPARSLPPDSPRGGGGKEVPPPPTVSVPEEPSPRVGWIEASYAPPLSSLIGDEDTPRSGRTKGEKPGGPLPETGDRGMDPAGLLWIMAGAVLLAAGIWRKKKQILLCLLLPPLFSAAVATDVRAEEMEQAGDGTELVLYVPAEGDEGPQQRYLDAQGQEYILYFYRPVEEEIPEERRSVWETRVYRGLEAVSQIPDTVTVEQMDEESGRIGSGQLVQSRVEEIGSYWTDDLLIPVVFHEYDADQFELQGIIIPKEDALDVLQKEQETFLAGLGCEQGRYEIREIVWDGESYMDQGVLCRRALAMGRKRSTDHQVRFEGTILYPAVTEKKWEARYRPVIPADPGPEEKEETFQVPEEPVPEAALLAPDPVMPPASQGSFWKAVRTFAAYTVSLAFLLPILFFLAAAWRKRR